ncbi:MAG: fatty acid desaturase [Actinocatenispora sp.]
MTSTGQHGTSPVRVAGGSEYAQLSRSVRAAGLLEKRSAYYAAKIIGTLLAFVAAWVAFVVIGPSWWQLGVAAVMAVLYTQIAFIGHDAGHKQVFRTRRANYLLGLGVGNLGIGLSYGWWVDKHNRHHAHPNTVDKDPDIDVGALVYSRPQARLRSLPGRLLSRFQAYLFFPMLLLEGINLHVSSIRALAGRTVKSPGQRALETGLFVAHLAGYLTIVFLVLEPWQAVAFIAVHQALFGVYMGLSFAPNHKGMPVLSRDDEMDYLRRQVLTSRNVRGGRLVDLLLGGLNYQIEHHLFPSMPRPNLRRSQQLVRDFCAEHRISYAETSLFGSYRLVLRHLYQVGRPLRSLPAD